MSKKVRRSTPLTQMGHFSLTQILPQLIFHKQTSRKERS